MTRLLLVEDDEDLSVPLARALRREGHVVEVVADGATALDQARRQSPELVILDLGLPRMGGLEVCERIRRSDLSVPVLILTARSEETDVVACLEAGADDYVTKPFRLAELLARVRALLRRPARARTPVVDPPVTIDRHSRRAFHTGRELPLTATEFDLLAVLHRQQGRVVTRERLSREIWGARPPTSDKTLDMHISAIRQKLDQAPDHRRHLVTVRGIGFRFQNDPEPAHQHTAGSGPPRHRAGHRAGAGVGP